MFKKVYRKKTVKVITGLFHATAPSTDDFQQANSTQNTKDQVIPRASLAAQMVKDPPAVQETWVQSLDWEDALEEGMATHSSILAWRIPWTQEPGRRSP